MELILASNSPQKKSLLNKLGLTFSTISATNNVKSLKNESPEAFARRVALSKADEVSKANKGAVVLSHTAVIDFNGEIIGKPSDSSEAEKILKSFSGKSHEFVGVVVLVKDGEELYVGSQRTKVSFKKLDKDTISKYVKTEEALTKPGAYYIQGDGGMFVENIEGSYFNVVGMPLTPLVRALIKLGFVISDDIQETIQMQERSIKESFPR